MYQKSNDILLLGDWNSHVSNEVDFFPSEDQDDELGDIVEGSIEPVEKIPYNL